MNQLSQLMKRWLVLYSYSMARHAPRESGRSNQLHGSNPTRYASMISSPTTSHPILPWKLSSVQLPTIANLSCSRYCVGNLRKAERKQIEAVECQGMASWPARSCSNLVCMYTSLGWLSTLGSYPELEVAWDNNSPRNSQSAPAPSTIWLPFFLMHRRPDRDGLNSETASNFPLVSRCKRRNR